MIEFLLPIHILVGTIALLCAALAVSSEKGKKIHVLSGRTYFWCMVVIFSTAIPMSIINNNIFLFLIAIFSFYLAFAGMRFARNRKGIATTLDWIAVSLMILSGLGMWILAAIYFTNDNSQYIVLLVFGFLAVFLGYGDYKSYKDKTATGKERIAKHLTNMMGGTIAVITAVLVVNPPSNPEWVWWVLPTALIVPVIFWWNVKVLK
jgi:hypothetical protein